MYEFDRRNAYVTRKLQQLQTQVNCLAFSTLALFLATAYLLLTR